MLRARCPSRLVCGLLLLTAGGCYSTPYSPYGPAYAPQGAYPGTFTAPGPTPTPVDPYSAPGTYMPPSTPSYPTEINQGDSNWQQSQRPNSSNPPANGTPYFEPDPVTPASKPRDVGIPRYPDTPPRSTTPTRPKDPVPPRKVEPLPPYNDNAEEFRQDPFPANSTPKPRSAPSDGEMFEGTSTPFGAVKQRSSTSVTSTSKIVQAGHEETDFEQPIEAQTVSVPRELENTSGHEEVSPYDHDRENFRWLRGVVDYDADEKTWNIIYSIDPDDADKLGGSVTLIGDEQLDALSDNDRVLVEGRLETSKSDARGKPCFHVEHLGRIVPE